MTDQSAAAPAGTTEMIAASILREVLTICPSDEALDDLVHDQANAKAASVNNDGFAAQINYLLNNGVSGADILLALSSSKTED
ncbi:hypothetical protein D9M71_830970 [compost metagenome]